MPKLVTLATFTTPEEAHLLKNRLEEEGIPAVLTDEQTVGISWHLANALGGVKLQVAEDHLDEACGVLREPFMEVEDIGQEEPADLEQNFESTAADEPAVEAPGDEAASRAWRAAVFGPFILPPLLSIFSLWMLGRLALSDTELSASSKSKAYGAFAVNLVVLFAAIGIVMAIFISIASS